MTEVFPYEIILGQRCERRGKMDSEWNPRIIVDFNKVIASIGVVLDIFHNSGCHTVRVCCCIEDPQWTHRRLYCHNGI